MTLLTKRRRKPQIRIGFSLGGSRISPTVLAVSLAPYSPRVRPCCLIVANDHHPPCADAGALPSFGEFSAIRVGHIAFYNSASDSSLVRKALCLRPLPPSTLLIPIFGCLS